MVFPIIWKVGNSKLPSIQDWTIFNVSYMLFWVVTFQRCVFRNFFYPQLKISETQSIPHLKNNSINILMKSVTFSFSHFAHFSVNGCTTNRSFEVGTVTQPFCSFLGVDFFFFNSLFCSFFLLNSVIGSRERMRVFGLPASSVYRLYS